MICPYMPVTPAPDACRAQRVEVRLSTTKAIENPQASIEKSRYASPQQMLRRIPGESTRLGNVPVPLSAKYAAIAFSKRNTIVAEHAIEKATEVQYCQALQTLLIALSNSY